jgi:sugar phosphate isomerase/epimerase
MLKIACGWLYALHRYGYPPSFENTLKGISEAAELGFDAFEMEAIGEENLKLLWKHRRELKDRIDSLGLTLANFVPMLPDTVSLDKQKRAHALEMFELGTELAVSLDAELVMCDSYEVPLPYVGEAPGDDPIHYGKNYRFEISADFNWDRVWENLVSVFRHCADVTANRGIRLAMETRLGEAVSNTDAFLRLHDAVGHSNFGMVFDAAHLHAQKEILPLSVEKLRDRVFLVHASDNDSRTNEHLPVGDGTIDWTCLLQALHKHEFDGYFVMDIGDCPDLEVAYRRSKKFLETIAS